MKCPRFWTRTPSFEQRRGLLSLQSVMDIDEEDMTLWMNVKQNWWELLKWRGKSGVRYECKNRASRAFEIAKEVRVEQ